MERRSVPLSLFSSKGLDRSIVLDKREATFTVDTSKPWKLNSGTIGVCELCSAAVCQRALNIPQIVYCTPLNAYKR